MLTRDSQANRGRLNHRLSVRFFGTRLLQWKGTRSKLENRAYHPRRKNDGKEKMRRAL